MSRLAIDSSSLIAYLGGRELQTIATLELTDGYWQRAGATRALVAAKGRRARLADTLIAQVCLDHDVSLVTNGKDFRAFSSVARLRVVP